MVDGTDVKVSVVSKLVKFLNSDEVEILRMVQWFMFAVIFYLAAILLANQGPTFYPQLQTLFWKLGQLTISSFLGYRIARSIFKDSDIYNDIGLAIVVGAAMIAVSLGM